jgi:hypothetical protein
VLAKSQDGTSYNMGSFAAGSSFIWLVKSRVKKVAVLRKDLPFHGQASPFFGESTGASIIRHRRPILAFHRTGVGDT